MLEELKSYKSAKGNTVDYELKKKYPEGKWIVEGNSYNYEAMVAHLKVIAAWEKTSEGFKAKNGKAIELTPHLNDEVKQLEERRKSVSQSNLKIYDYIRLSFGEHGDEEVSFEEASSKFGLTVKDIEAIYYRVDELLYKK